MKYAAVVAHSESSSESNRALRGVLEALLQVVERVVVVTTSDVPVEIRCADTRIAFVARPAIGSYFVSYRLGLEQLKDHAGYDGVFFLHVKFEISDQTRFVDTLRTLSDGCRAQEIRGLTEAGLLRSYLHSQMLFMPRPVLQSDWFRSFVASIRPLNTQKETLQAYEVGLSRQAVSHHVALTPIVRRGRAGWRESPGKEALASLLWGRWINYNPLRGGARWLADTSGVVPLRDKGALEGSPGHLPWIREVSIKGSPEMQPDIAVVVHAFYTEPLEELSGLLKHITEPFDLFVTTPHEADVPRIIESLHSFPVKMSIVVCENRGRDIGPFVSLLRRGALGRYAAVLKVHLKRSLYSPSGDEWRRLLFSGLCGDAATVRRCVELLRQGSVGIIGPHAQFLTHRRFWGSNRSKVARILNAVGVTDKTEVRRLGFFAGSMFWFSPSALEPLRGISDTVLSFEAEAGLRDGTTAHALERAFTQVAKHAGFVVTSEKLLGGDMYEVDASTHTVPVL